MERSITNGIVDPLYSISSFFCKHRYIFGLGVLKCKQKESYKVFQFFSSISVYILGLLCLYQLKLRSLTELLHLFIFEMAYRLF